MLTRIALAVALVLSVVQLAAADSSIVGYDDVLYPDGMPVVDGKSPKFDRLSKCTVPGTDRIVVLYSLNDEFYRDEFSEEFGYKVYDLDIPRRVFIGVLKKDGDNLSLVSNTDISNKLFDDSYILDEGCKELTGYVSAVDVFRSVKFFKLGIDVLFAGKGNIQFTSVYLFELDKNDTPIIALNLGEVSGFGQARYNNYSRYSKIIYAAEVGGVPEILSRSEEIEVDAEHQVYREMVQDGYSVNIYDADRHVFKPPKTVQKLPAGAKEIFK